MTPERWKLCPIAPRYLVSDLGRVRRIGGWPLKPWRNPRGYCYVDLGRALRGQAVHRLVVLTFAGHLRADDHVDHLNFDRTDNRAANLRPLSPAANSVRWAGRRGDGTIVWETPDDIPDDHHAPTPAELEELHDAWHGPAALTA